MKKILKLGIKLLNDNLIRHKYYCSTNANGYCCYILVPNKLYYLMIVGIVFLRNCMIGIIEVVL